MHVLLSNSEKLPTCLLSPENSIYFPDTDNYIQRLLCALPCIRVFCLLQIPYIFPDTANYIQKPVIQGYGVSPEGNPTKQAKSTQCFLKITSFTFQLWLLPYDYGYCSSVRLLQILIRGRLKGDRSK